MSHVMWEFLWQVILFSPWLKIITVLKVYADTSEGFAIQVKRSFFHFK